MTDFACEIKFYVGNESFNIDVVKQEMETGKKYYQAIVALSVAQAKNSFIFTKSMEALNKVIVNDANHFTAYTDAVANLVNKYQPENYGAILEAYLH
jgi:hypothetical protein